MKMQENELRRLIQAYTDGTATFEEKELLEKFFDTYRREAEEDHSSQDELMLFEKEIRSNIHRRIKPVKRFGAAQWWSIAASLTALVIITSFFLANRADEKVKLAATPTQLERNTGKGQKLTLKLPDGSRVKMNSSSSLSFPENFNGSVREVILQGEAYFQVAHNPAKPFIVRTANARTTVLGTSFNVNTKQKEKTAVTLVEGKVNVIGLNAPKAIRLKPNQQAIILDGAKVIDTLSVDVSDYIEWKDDILAFNKTPMRDVVKELEDWYGVEIELKNKSLNKCRITARYEGESLENVMKSFEFMLKGNFKLEGKKVTLSAKGCNGHQ